MYIGGAMFYVAPEIASLLGVQSNANLAILLAAFLRRPLR